jgi:glycosyltransferase involved in cell wall biosynthesis
MLDLRGLIDKGLGRAGERPVLLAAPFDVPNLIAADFFRQGRVAGVVVNDPTRHCSLSDVPVLGRWVGSHYSRLRLNSDLPNTLLFLGTSRQLGGNILLESARRGIRRIIYLHPLGNDFEERSPAGWLLSKVSEFLLSKLSRNRSLARLTRPALALGKLSFDRGYQEVLERASFLRLPPDAFDSRYALLAIGTLGPGGAERQLVYTARGIARFGHWRVGVCAENLTPPFANFHEATLRASGVSVHQVPVSHAAPLAPKIAELIDYFTRKYSVLGFHHVVQDILSYALLLRDQRPHLLHSWMDACNVRAGIAAMLVGVPRLILSGRSVAPDNFEIFRPYMSDGYKAVLSAGDPMLLNNSRAGAADYARWLGIERGRIETLHNGFEFPDDIACRRSRARAALQLEAGDVVLGGILRCSEEKRPDLWVEVAKQFVQCGDRRRAILYGDGPMREAMLRKVEECGLVGKILMPGVTSDSWTALAGFDIFLLSSRMEGLPNVLVEAQAAGVPIVCPDVGGVSEAVLNGSTGFLVKDDRAATLARHCIDLARDETLRRNMGASAAIFARAHFSAERMVAQTVTVYGVIPQKEGTVRHDFQL